MTTKEKMLTLLENNKGEFVSGERASLELSVSRTAVWKAVKTLQREGYEIEAVRNKGYCLPEETDILSVSGIINYLDELSYTLPAIDLHLEKSVTSTNTVLKELADDGAEEGYILAALTQTAGKGRVGRSFYSPDQTGLYISILLRPLKYDAARASRITTMAAVAACKAIENVSETEAVIKWVNDVYVHGKKAVGILTEASINLETGFIDYAVLGIGFNVYEPQGGFPQEIRKRAGAILAKPVGDAKNRLAASFIHEFMCFYENEKTSDLTPAYIKEYQTRCFVVGQDIDILEGDKKTPAHALSVDDECRLIVRYEDGHEQALSAGEVSIRV